MTENHRVTRQLGHSTRWKCCFAAGLGLWAALGLAISTVAAVVPTVPATLFTGTNVWTVRLRFTAEQWDAMEPKGGFGGGFFGGFGGRGFGGPGGGAGPALPGPSALLAPAFLKFGDTDKDGALSRDEFRALAVKWMSEWDKDNTGRLAEEQFRAGLNAAVEMPAVGQGGGAGPGINLQGPEGKRNGLASAAGLEFEYVRADLEIEGKQLPGVAVRYKGNGTFMQARGSLKRSLKISLDETDPGRRWAGVSKLNLHNNVTDATWMNESLAYRLFRDAGVPAPRTAYARVYVTVPGRHADQYFGLYSLVEDIDKHFATEVLPPGKGVIFKPVTQNLFGDLGDDWKAYNQSYDPKGSVPAGAKQRVIEFSKLVSRADDREFATKLPGFLDLEEFARFMAVTVWLANFDSLLDMGQNFYLHLDAKTKKFQFLPWDLDHSFGQFGLRGSQSQRENLSIQHPWVGDNRFLERVFNVDEFKKLYLGKLAEFSGTIFQPARFHRQVDELTVDLRPAVKEESADKLARFEQAAGGKAVAGSGMEAFFGASQPIKPFVTARARSVQDQLAGKSAGDIVAGFNFGGFGGRGGAGGPGGPGGIGAGTFLAARMSQALDSNHDSVVTRDEFSAGFAGWFTRWNPDGNGRLTGAQLRAGIDRDLAIPPDGGFRGPP